MKGHLFPYGKRTLQGISALGNCQSSSGKGEHPLKTLRAQSYSLKNNICTDVTILSFSNPGFLNQSLKHNMIDLSRLTFHVFVAQ